MAVFTVVLRGGAPWGFRLQGGSDFNEPLRIAKINPNSKAYNEGVSVGDYVEGINGHRTQGLPNNDAQQLIRQAGNQLEIELYRAKSLNGPVNGDVPVNGDAQHIPSVSDDQFYTGDSDTSYRSYNPVSYGSRSRDYTSPSQDSQNSLTITVNSRKVTGSSPPSSPKYQSSISFLPSSPASTRATTSDRDFGFRPKSHSLVDDLPSPSTSTSMFNSSTLGRPRGSSRPVHSSSFDGYNTVPTTMTKSKGMNLFLKQQEKLGQLGDEIQALTTNINTDFEPARSPPTTSENLSTSPMPVHTSTPTFAPRQTARPMPAWSMSEDEGSGPRPRRGKNLWQSDTEDAFKSSVDYRLRLGEKKSAPAPLWTGSFSGQKSSIHNHKPSTAPIWTPHSTIAASSTSGPSWPQSASTANSQHSWIPPRPAESTKPQTVPSWIPPRPDQAGQPSSPQWAPKPAPSWVPPSQQANSRSPQPWPTPGDTQQTNKPSWMPKSPEPEKPRDIISPSGSLVEPQVFDVPIIIQKDNVPIYIQKKKAAPSETNLSAAEPEYSRAETNGFGANNSLQNSITNEGSFNSEKTSTSFSKPGVWAPGVKSQPIISDTEAPPQQEPSLRDIAPVWTPGGGTNTIKKGFKPVKLDTSVKNEKPKPVVSQPDPKPSESFAWQPQRSDDSSRPATSTFVYTPLNDGDAPPEPVHPPPAPNVDFTSMNGNTENMDSLRNEPSRLPPTQSPYITLLQKNREEKLENDEFLPDVPQQPNSLVDYPSDGDPTQELNIVGSPITVTEEGQIPKGAVYLGKKEVIEGDVKHTDEYYAVPQEGEETKTTKVVEQKPKIYPGIGPTDEEGVPLAFRKNIDESKQSDWYKQMFKSLHITDKKEDDKVDIDRLLEGQETNTYKPTYRFPASEDQKSVEARMNALNVSKSRTLPKDSNYTPSLDVSTSKEKSATLERDKPRQKASFGKDFRRNEWAPVDVKAKPEVYKIQPRSIMDYEPGFSSIAFHETKAARRLSQSREKEKGVTHNPPIEKPGQFNKYNVGKVKPEVKSFDDQDDERDGKVAYKHIQKGGEIPYKGLGKPAPDKPVEWIGKKSVVWTEYIYLLTLMLAT